MEESVVGFDKNKLQLPIEEPNINWEVLGKLDDKLISDNFARTLHIGSCAEHIIHDFLKDGIDKSEWRFDKLLKAMFIA